jgi:hypothetical protein
VYFAEKCMYCKRYATGAKARRRGIKSYLAHLQPLLLNLNNGKERVQGIGDCLIAAEALPSIKC